MNKISPNMKIFKIYVTWLWQPVSVGKWLPTPVCHTYSETSWCPLSLELSGIGLMIWKSQTYCVLKKMQISGKISLFWPQSHCKWSDIKILSLLIQFFVWFYTLGPIYKGIYEEGVSFSLQMTLLISASSRTQPGPQSDTFS